MSIYSSRQLGRFGHMGNALGAFGGGGIAVFPGGPSFAGSDTPDVWFGTNPNWNQAGFNALSSGVLNQAGVAWAALQNAIADKDIAFLDSMKQALSNQMKDVDTYVGAHSVLGYTQTAVDQGLNALKQLQTSVRKIAAYRVFVPPPDAAVTPPGSALSPSTSSIPANSSAGSASRGGLPVPGDGTSGSGGPQASSDNTMLYVGLGVGAVALLGGAFVLLKKRSSSVAGYRRRRSRR